MLGLVQHQPLMLIAFLEHAAQNYPDVCVVERDGDRTMRTSYRETAARTRRLASGLLKRGIAPGDLVGSLAWSTQRHFELLYAVPGIGATLHTANPRLSDDHISYSIHHARERVLFVDRECVVQAERLAPRLPNVVTYVVMADRSEVPSANLPGLVYFDDIVADGDDSFEWPQFDERTASTVCFTSGTTGDPKGAVYSHRGSYLSTLAIAAPNVWGVGSDDAIIATAAFFHCNGWGAPYLAPMAGAKLVLPGRDHDAASLRQLIVDEGVTVGPGVPTIWHGIAEHCRREHVGLGRLNRIVWGGAAPPLELMRTYWRDFGVRSLQAWGMTETTHAATFERSGDDVLNGETEPLAAQGKPVFGTQIRIIDGDGRPLPKDGIAAGHLQVKAHWCASGYLHRDDVALNDPEGWLNTGDLATIGRENGLRITDRIKDVIKSGGEWISSIDLENAALGHPGVAGAAVIGVPHPRWQERPV
ncbi:MAG TPA: AMP-binding protein, partial [Rhizomicrobium sp.]